MSRGLLLLLFGVLFNVLGWYIKEENLGHYGWAMILGTILFGIGFISVFYSLVRKVERQAILEDRAVKSERLANQEEDSQ